MSVLRQRNLTYLLAAVLAAVVVVPVAADNDQQQYVEKFERTVPLVANGSVSLHNIAGNIDVNSWGRGEVRIEAMKVSRAATQELARANADEVAIEVAAEGNRV